ncbi:MAG: hypothetical protein A3C38_02535 [Planctomycetes bacterium RIFCSPHIGHO2_02_FULL_50_42]|nr:MAG: hypothetical protein A3C38_02535 [Planctomycetes bacterium RIFCSPHIGHO2_02_FULL_50_42]OHB95716.1 MAG: hypothetical protein A3I59_06800 [Planctomycetes bacterium RIFCSPLOWO2_02_FULL_50_16]OHC02960.1 MAG: hypothetical protein A3G17_07520 [Planctomycetes bacterium RIFCSPLOWO2_12_FULL_50_35]
MKILRRLLILLIVMPTCIGFGATAYSKGIITVNISQYPIRIIADGVSSWQMEGVRVFSAGGNVKITQGKMQLSANNVVCWFYELEAGQKPEARVEILSQGDVVLIQGRDYEKYEEVYLQLETIAGVMVNTYSGAPVQTFGEEQLVGNHLKLKKIKELDLPEFAYKEPLELELEGGPPGVPGVVDVVANDIDSWEEGGKRVIVAVGDVEIRRGEQLMTADNAILWFDQEEKEGKKTPSLKEFYAEGNVTIAASEKAKEIKHADKVFENFKESKGFYVNPKIKTTVKNFPLPIYMGGREMKQIDPDSYEVKDGYLTTCSFGHPHFHVKSPKIRIKRRVEDGETYTEAKAYDNVFYFGQIPTAYLPVYKYDTQKKESLLIGYGVGSSQRFGTFLRTAWNPYALAFVPSSLSDWSSLVTKLEYLNKRGPAGGFEFEYDRDDTGTEGFLETYYVKDKLLRDEVPPRLPITDKNRGRVLWRNRQEVTEELRADTELSYLSDRGFLKEYFEEEFQEGKKQETYLNLRRLKDNRGATFLAKDEINKFQTGFEAWPQVTYHAIGQPLWENRLNMTSESNFGYLNMQIGNELESSNNDVFNRLRSTTGKSFRFDSDNTLSAPFKWWILKANPFVGGRLTGYSKSLENNGPNGDATGRFIGSLGFEGSTQLWRAYALENKLLRINGLRHIITPEVRWIAAPIVTKKPEDLLQYERSDALNDYNTATISLRNRMQTRRGPPWALTTVDLLEFDIGAHLLNSPKKTATNLVVPTLMTPEGVIIPRRDSYLQFDLRTPITNRITLESVGNEFNLSNKTFDVLNIGTTFKRSEDWDYFVGFRHIDKTSNTVTLSTNTLIGKKWRLNVAEAFDLGARTESGDTTSKNLFSNFSFTRESHDWIAGFNVFFDVVDRNKVFSFVFQPKGIAKSIGQSYSLAGR